MEKTQPTPSKTDPNPIPVDSTQQQIEPKPQEATTYTTHHLKPLPGLTETELRTLTPHITQHHTYQIGPRQCSSLLSQRINAPDDVVWSILRRFDKPQTYKHFIKSCSVSPDFSISVGSTRYVTVISGLPAATSTERLDLLDDHRRVFGISIIGGDHRLRNYRSVTTVHRIGGDGENGGASAAETTVVLESYVVDMPEGNSEEDTRLFADTVIKLNLQKLASVSESVARGDDAPPSGGGHS